MPGRQLALAPALVEEGDPQVAGAVGDVGGDQRPDRGPRVRRPEMRSTVAEDHGLLAEAEVGRPGLAGPVDVAPRVVREQVEHGLDAERLPQRGRACFSPTPFRIVTSSSASCARRLAIPPRLRAPRDGAAAHHDPELAAPAGSPGPRNAPISIGIEAAERQRSERHRRTGCRRRTCGAGPMSRFIDADAVGEGEALVDGLGRLRARRRRSGCAGRCRSRVPGRCRRRSTMPMSA